MHAVVRSPLPAALLLLWGALGCTATAVPPTREARLGGTGRAQADRPSTDEGGHPLSLPLVRGEDPSAPSPLAGRATSADVAGPTDVGSRTESRDSHGRRACCRLDFSHGPHVSRPRVLARLLGPSSHQDPLGSSSPGCSPSRPTARRPTACWRRPCTIAASQRLTGPRVVKLPSRFLDPPAPIGPFRRLGSSHPPTVLACRSRCNRSQPSHAVRLRPEGRSRS